MNTIQTDALNLLSDNAQQLIEYAENSYQKQVADVAQEILKRKADDRVVLLSGPSAAGKTWSARLLCEHLKACNVPSVVVSLDRFYKERARDIADIESVESLDKPLLIACLQQLMQKHRTKLPHYSFFTGLRDREDQVDLDENGCVIIEGIHALNPILFTDNLLKHALCIAVNVESSFYNNGAQVLSAQELRLCRRILRDRSHRGASLKHTITLWKHTLQSERKFIIPYFYQAKFRLDSTHIYEPLLYRQLLTPIFSDSEDTEIETAVNHLKRGLSFFSPISADLLPNTSLLMEFVC